MITAVDSSVLFAVGKGEGDGSAWVNLLRLQGELGPLIVCDVVAAEVSAFFERPEHFLVFLQDLQVEYVPVDRGAAILAGSLFRSYLRAGGPREHMVPDFIVGAHASRQSDQLAASDRGFLRRYFPRLKILAPR
jgi:predicted nucleic acid-binding protein